MAFKVLPDADLGQIVSDEDMSGSIVSQAFNLRQRKSVTIQLVWTGNPVGPFAIQASVNHAEDIDGNVQVPGDWNELPLSANIAAEGTPDSAYIELQGVAAPYVRLVYAAVSGAGTLNAYVSAKGG